MPTPVTSDGGSPASTASAALRRCSWSSTTSSCARSPATPSTTLRSGPPRSSTGASRSSCSSCCRGSRWRCRPLVTTGGSAAIARFAQRRAWRILPAYWGALAFSLAVAWLVAPQPHQAVPGTKSVLVNGLLVQNLVGAPSPNRAFWSMAVEAQLYLVFPLLLLMVRRWSAVAMVAVVTLVVAAVGVVGPHVPRLDTFVVQSAPDLAALFAIGILAAGIVTASRARRSWPWGWLALALAVPVLATIWLAGLGVDARPSVLGRPRVRPGHRVPARRPGHRPPGRARAGARRAAAAQPRRRRPTACT